MRRPVLAVLAALFVAGVAQASPHKSEAPQLIGLRIVQGDVFDLPFAAGSFDYALTAMFLHHLADGEVVAVLRTMGRLARRGVIVADLLRHYRAYAWVSLFTLFSTPMALMPILPACLIFASSSQAEG